MRETPPPEPRTDDDDLMWTVWDEFILACRKEGLDFTRTFDAFFNAHPRDRRYVYKGPGFLGLFEDREHPFLEDQRYWHIFWLSMRPPLTFLDISEYLPYELPFIGFCRALKNRREPIIRSTQDLKRYCKLNHELRK